MSARYQVINKGRSMWHVIDRSTGRCMGFAQHPAAAAQKAEKLEGRMRIALGQLRHA